MRAHRSSRGATGTVGRLAALVVCAAALCACSHEPAPEPITTRLELRDEMRELWTAHVVWTRVVIIDTVAGLPDAPHASERLLRNQADIGDAIRPFYGDAAGDHLTELLREHILGAVEVLDAAQAGDPSRLGMASDAWFVNADEISRFLADANPRWRFEDLQSLMHHHLEQTIAEATARLTGDWGGDVVGYDEIQDHILVMADVLADGIAAQFPERVADTSISTGDEELHLAMRDLWQDHVTWTRFYLISAIAGLPDVEHAAARLLRNQDEIGDALRPIYGDAAGDRASELLREHITGAVVLVEAAAAGDPQAATAARAAWDVNAGEIASFLAGANPVWAEEDLREMMLVHLDQTQAEAVARLEGDWAGDVAIYDEIVTHILEMADVLSSGIAVQHGHSDTL